MLPFALEKAHSAEEAIAAAAAGGRYIAGGTTLIDLMREEVEHPERLIDINALPLGGVRVEGGGDLVIGALARMAEVAADPDVLRVQPLIAESLIEGASPQLRNMASIGGNLLQRVRCPYFRMLDAACNKRTPGSGCAAIDGLNAGHAILGTSDHCVATHPSDLAVALVALDATMRVRGPQGERSFPVEELYRLPSDMPHLEHTLLPGDSSSRCAFPAAPTVAARAISSCATGPPTSSRSFPRRRAGCRGRRDPAGAARRWRRGHAALALARMRDSFGRSKAGAADFRRGR
jgi:xanthine dehydrogenase YagS FAD-binding subunit